MKGDFTRDTFHPLKNFSRVLMQQGRVQLDADWNEQASILLYHLRTLAADILGPHAGPEEELGFDLITKTQTIFKNGTAKREATVWENIETDDARRKYLIERAENGSDFVIGTGRYYVDGLLAENHRPILYSEQAGYPLPDEPTVSEKDNVVLDVWERHITHVQDDQIREVALGGADTCTRAQVVWQVKALLYDAKTTFDCDSLVDNLRRTKLPKLRARARHDTPSPEQCSVSPESKYRGLENHLYRVEVHEVDVAVKAKGKGKTKNPPTTATFKWSRDNGSVVFPIVSLAGDTAIVTTLGSDQCSQLKPGDWVEVCDDELALREQSGALAQVERVDRDELEITLKWPDGVEDPPSYAEGDTRNHPLLRRWDHVGNLTEYHGALPIVERTEADDDRWIPLEDGVEIWFVGGGPYWPGDYWLIPARVATGDVEWPQELDDDGAPKADAPAALPPHGPKHHYAPLFHVKSWGVEKPKDCRSVIKPPVVAL
jgi:hypothetical protein